MSSLLENRHVVFMQSVEINAFVELSWLVFLLFFSCHYSWHRQRDDWHRHFRLREVESKNWNREPCLETHFRTRRSAHTTVSS